jgi:uncharacterized protein YndB with AHSA1/START domain
MFWSHLLLLALLPLNSPDPGWQPAYDRQGVRVWTRQPADPTHQGALELRAESTVAAPPERVWAVVNDLAHYPEFMPYVVDARLVAQHHGHRFEYIRLNPPVISPRDYTLAVDRTEDAAKHLYVRRWTTANAEGPPPRRDSVRLALCDGSWTVQPAADGIPSHTQLTYWLMTDPAGSTPSWIARRASTQGIPDLLDAIAKRSLEPNWRP